MRQIALKVANSDTKTASAKMIISGVAGHSTLSHTLLFRQMYRSQNGRIIINLYSSNSPATDKSVQYDLLPICSGCMGEMFTVTITSHRKIISPKVSTFPSMVVPIA
jgi:hypothetical protein